MAIERYNDWKKVKVQESGVAREHRNNADTRKEVAEQDNKKAVVNDALKAYQKQVTATKNGVSENRPVATGKVKSEMPVKNAPPVVVSVAPDVAAPKGGEVLNPIRTAEKGVHLPEEARHKTRVSIPINNNTIPRERGVSFYVAAIPQTKLADLVRRSNAPATSLDKQNKEAQTLPPSLETGEVVALPQTAQGPQTADSSHKQDKADVGKGRKERKADGHAKAGGKGALGNKEIDSSNGEQQLEAASSGVASDHEPGVYFMTEDPDMALPSVMLGKSSYDRIVQLKLSDESVEVIVNAIRADLQVEQDPELDRMLRMLALGRAARKGPYDGGFHA